MKMNFKVSTASCLVLMVIVCALPVLSTPTGPRQSRQLKTESAKVTKIREKLQKLQDLLNYKNDEDLVKDAHHLSRQRTLTSEDMERRATFGSDGEEQALSQLVQNGGIRARALNQLSSNVDSRTEKNKVKDDSRAEMNDDKQYTKAASDIAAGKHDKDDKSSDRYFEQVLDQLLKKLLQEENDIKTTPLFHNKNNKGNNNNNNFLNTIDDPKNEPSPNFGQPSTMNQKDGSLSSNALLGSISEDELYDFLLKNIGANNPEKQRKKSREQQLADLESKLMHDIETANTIGVSVDDLIQDLEDKAFKQAVQKRIAHILRSP